MIKHKIIPHSMGLFKVNQGRNFINGRPIPVTYEARSMNRWIMTVHGSQGGQSFFVKNNNGIHMVTRVEEISFMTTSYRFMPRYEWDPLTVEIYDYTCENSNPGYIRDWMMSHTDGLTGRHGYASDYKRYVELEKYDPTGLVVEKWALEGSFISSFNHEVVYDQEMGNMELTIMFDNARLIF